MSVLSPSKIATILAVLLAGAGIGYGVARLQSPGAPAASTSAAPPRKPLYYYDPMVPTQHFDKPGKSPMGMEMVPRYAESGTSGGEPAGVRISPATEQNLGVRVATVRRGDLASAIDAVGVLGFDQRDVAIIQSRSAGFVEHAYARAPGDIVRAGAPLATVLIPAWGGAQEEFLAVERAGDPRLTAAARQRLTLLGMPSALISQVEHSGQPRDRVTISTPIAGAIQTLDVRQGMTVSAGQTLAQVSGLSTIWLDAAVPEAQAGQVRVGAASVIDIAAFPGEAFSGRVIEILPTTESQSRTLTVRVELPNRGGKLRPGMFATVHLASVSEATLLVPSEAVIRTGTRDLVMVAGTDGRYRPVVVEVGREAGNETQILAGLSEGQKIVASGEFLIDSEASLSGIHAQPLGAGVVGPPLNAADGVSK